MRNQFNYSATLFLRVMKFGLALFSIIFLFSECNPKDPPSPQQYYHRDRPPINLGSRAGYVVSPLCPNPGTECYIPIPPYYVPPSQYYARLTQLASYYAAHNVPGFFDLYSDWDILFPGFTIDHPEIQKVIHGEYQLEFYSDTAFAVYDPNLTPYNLVYLFKMYE